jgi:hypothetical protein
MSSDFFVTYLPDRSYVKDLRVRFFKIHPQRLSLIEFLVITIRIRDRLRDVFRQTPNAHGKLKDVVFTIDFLSARCLARSSWS